MRVFSFFSVLDIEVVLFVFFFFQAEDGIRDRDVTGVQTCALPIWLPCEVNRPNTANRCNNATDANWGGNSFFGQNGWDAFLMGASLNGVLGSPAMTDNTYDMGYRRLQGVLPFPTTGAFNGFSTAYLTSYASGGLMSNRYRDLALTAYAWQIATTTGGPNAWWEANGSGPNGNNPWAGSHAPPQFGAIPYAWPQ